MHRHRYPDKEPHSILPWATGAFFAMAIGGLTLTHGQEETPQSSYQILSAHELMARSQSRNCMVDMEVTVQDMVMQVPEVSLQSNNDDKLFFTLHPLYGWKYGDPRLTARMKQVPKELVAEALSEDFVFNNAAVSVTGTFHEAAGLHGLPDCVLDIATVITTGQPLDPSIS